MFKFLRKYNKWILAVGGTLLMITFLIPQAIEGLGQQMGGASATVARVGEEKVRADEWTEIQAQVQWLERLGFTLPTLGPITSPEHWYLLRREAQEAGLIGAASAVQITPEELAQFRSTGQSAEFIRRTEADLRGVVRLLGLYANANQLSDRRMRNFAQRQFYTVRVQPIVLQATADEDVLLTEEQIAEQFEKYNDVAPGEGEMGFGYKLPDRAKVEWMTVRAQTVRDTLDGSEAMSNIALYKHWLAHAGDPAYNFPAFSEDEDIPLIVRTNLLDELTAAKLEEIVQFIKSNVFKSVRSLKRAEGYYELPEDWASQQVKLPALAEAIREEFGIQLPSYESTGDHWQEMEDLQTLEGIGLSSTDEFGQTMNLSSLAAQAKEFGGSPTYQVQEGIVGPILHRIDGSIDLFRLTDTSPAHAPTSVDEVRQQVVDDLKRLSSYRELIARQSEIEKTAEEQGMLQLSIDHKSAIQNPTDVSLFNPQYRSFLMQGMTGFEASTPLPVIGENEEAVARIVDYALTLPADVDVQTLPEADRIFTVPVEDSLALLVVRIMRTSGLSESEFAEFVRLGVLRQMMADAELDDGEVLKEAFSYEALARRHQFELPQPENAEEAEDDTEEAEVASAG